MYIAVRQVVLGEQPSGKQIDQRDGLKKDKEKKIDLMSNMQALHHLLLFNMV